MTIESTLLNTEAGKLESLTDWDNEPSLLDLKNDLTEATPAHDHQVSNISTWLDNLHVKGAAKPKKVNGRSSIQPKLIRKQAEWRYASLSEPFLSTEDIFNVSPVTWEDKDAAIQNELVLNHQFNNQLNKVDFIDEYVRTAVDEGTVIVRVGWDYQEEIEEVEQPIYELQPTFNPQAIQEQQQLHQLMQESPAEYNDLPDIVKQAHEQFMQTGVPVVPVQTGTETVEEVKVLKNQPTIEVCDYHNVIVDPTCEGNFDKAEFIIYSFETSKSELEKSGIEYKNLDLIHLTDSSPLSDPDHESADDHTFNFKDEPRKKVVAYEYWGYYDIHGTGKTSPFVATWVGNTLIRMEESPYPDGKLPFVKAHYLPVRKSIYGEPDGVLLEDNQKIIGATTRGMIDIMARSANGQIGIRKDALDVTNKRKYEKGQDYEFNPTVDPRVAVINHTYPEIPASAQFMIDLQNAEAESLTGVKAFHSGISGQALGNTATGIRSALDATSKRELGILRRLAAGIKEIGRKIIAMNSQFLADTEVVRITNDQFVDIYRDNLEGQFDLKLSISTAEADNEKAQELAFMLQTMGNNMDIGMSKIILSDIARLRKMPDLAKQIENYEPQPDPLVQRERELQIALLEAQVNNENAKAQENAVDVELKRAKTQAELARVRELNSNADLTDLAFLEKESGVDQAKELEKQQQKIEGDLLKETARQLSIQAAGGDE